MSARASDDALARAPEGGLGSWEFADDAVRVAIEVVGRSGVVPQLCAWRSAERERLGRHPGGAPERFSSEALFVAMTLAALHHRPMLATTFRDILFRHITPTMRARLGVPEPPPVDDRRAWEALHRCVRTRLHGLLDAVDPSVLPKNRRLAPDELDAAVRTYRAERDLSDEVLAARHDRLTWLVNALLEASLSYVPRDIRRHWRGSVAVDATPVPAFSRAEERERRKGRGRRTVVTHAADPDAGYYVRADDQPGTDRAERKLRDAIWAYEATIVVSGNDNPNTEQPFPCLVEAMAPLHQPGTAVGQNATLALTSLAARGHPTGWLAGDRAYTNAQPEHFQLPARALGYRPILDYRIDQLGVQNSHGGGLMIEGAWYCPAIPDALQNATIEFRARRIDETTWRERIEARRPFLMRRKERPDAEGHVRRLCPASDPAYTGRCELKPRSIERTTATTTRIPVTDAQRLHPAKVCVQQSTTFPPEAAAKFAQDLHFGSTEWAGIYHTLRNAVEGINGIAKDGGYAALGDARRRRIRGVTAQSLFAALLLMATNMRAIRSFQHKALPDIHGTLRRRRKRRRATQPIAAWTPSVVARAGAPPP